MRFKTQRRQTGCADPFHSRTKDPKAVTARLIKFHLIAVTHILRFPLRSREKISRFEITHPSRDAKFNYISLGVTEDDSPCSVRLRRKSSYNWKYQAKSSELLI